jgi:hypothetical protein
MEKEVSTKKKAPVKRASVEETGVTVGATFSVHKKSADEVIKKCKRIKKVESDKENVKAREIAKSASELKTTINKARTTLNKPLKERIDKNNADAKLIIEPITGQIDRLKVLIGDYEQEKENARQEALKKAEEERLAKEKEERKRQEAIQLIRNKINDIQNDYNTKIHECKTSKTLDKYEKEIKALKITKKEFGEQVESMEQVKEILLQQVIERYVVVKQLEKASGEEKKELIAEQEKKHAENIETKTLEEQQMDVLAEQELITLVSSLHSKDCGWTVDDKMAELVEKYGSCNQANMFRDDIIANEQSHTESNKAIKELEGDKVKNQRKEVKFKIVDATKIPREFMKVDEAKIRATMGENRADLKNDINSFKIEGVEFYIESTTVLK